MPAGYPVELDAGVASIRTKELESREYGCIYCLLPGAALSSIQELNPHLVRKRSELEQKRPNLLA